MTRLLSTYWFGELLLIAIFGSIVLLAAVLSPSPEAVSLFGVEIPMVCSFRRLTGYGCIGCGLTRSFSFMAHGRVWEALSMNYLGPFLFIAFASQPPYRLYRLYREWSRRQSRTALQEKS